MGKGRIQSGDFEIAVNDHTKLLCKKGNEENSVLPHKLRLEKYKSDRRTFISISITYERCVYIYFLRCQKLFCGRIKLKSAKERDREL